MTANLPLSYLTSRGTVYYTPPSVAPGKTQPSLPDPPCRPRQRRPLLINTTRLPVTIAPLDFRHLDPPSEQANPSRLRLELRKLASREGAKRVLGSVFSSLTSTSSSTASSSAASSSRSASPNPSTPRASFQAASADPTSLYSRRSRLGDSSGLDDSAMSRTAVDDLQGAMGRSSIRTLSRTNSGCETEKPVASGNGVAVSIILAEPNIFLSGLDQDGTTRNSGQGSVALLRGKLRLNVTKSAKIKTITLKFTGRARTEWPEGIPPEKTITFEEESLKTQHIPFFNALYEGSETGYGTLCNYRLRENKSATSSVTNLSSTVLDHPPSPSQIGFSLPGIGNRTSRSSTILSAKDIKRLSLQSNQSRSFTKSESPFGPTPAQKGFKVFHPGTYEYSFELPIDNNSPETTQLANASVKWQLEAFVERAGTFRANLQGFKEIPVIRSPSEDSLELVEPISINRKWEDQLHYEIMISGKSFPLGSKIPIAFKLTPLAKVQVHKIKVYVSENCEYFTSNKKVTRKDGQRKLLLLEKSAGKPLAKEYSTSQVNVLRGGELTPEDRAQARAMAQRQRDREAARNGRVSEPLPEPSENLLGDIDLGLEHFWGATEIEMNVQLPTCEMMEKDRTKRLHHDCTWKNANVHHWIKIVMRISRLDADDPTGKKRRHFEISIDSPFTILDCRASRDNLSLPEYSGLSPGTQSQQHVCGCPNAAITNTSPASSTGEVPTLTTVDGPPDGPETFTPNLARPPQAHLSTNAMVQRPIHMLRNPSYNPPAFDAEEPPPPIATPPPLYDQIIGTPSHDGLADYFARLGEAYDDEDPTDDEDANRAYTSRGRVNVANPRTPGGRLARSMDIDRNFMFNPATFNNTLSRETGSGTVSPT